MTTDDTMTLAYQIKEKKNTQKLQTKDGPINKRSFKNIKITLGWTYLQRLFLIYKVSNLLCCRFSSHIKTIGLRSRSQEKKMSVNPSIKKQSCQDNVATAN